MLAARRSAAVAERASARDGVGAAADAKRTPATRWSASG
jgi:hypothetical protein